MAENEGATSQVQKAILEMRVQELETNENILEMSAKREQRKYDFLFKVHYS